MKKMVLMSALLLLLVGCAGGNANDSGIYTTIATYNESAFLSEAVTMFNQMNPDTPVRLNVFSAPRATNENARIEMFVNYMSTAFMSGNADDIVVFANLPFHQYFDMLADLMPFMEQSNMLQSDNYFTKLFRALQSDGRQFILPIDFNVDVVAFNNAHAEHFNTQNGISFMEANRTGVALLDHLDGNHNIGLYDFDAFPMFFNTLNSNFNQYIDLIGGQSRLNNDSFVEMLEMYRYLEQRRFIPSMKDFMEGFTFDETIIRLSDIRDIRLLVGLEEPFTNVTTLAGTGGEVYFTSHIILGLNDMSQNKDTAWVFIEFLLSETMQQSLSLPALPVNRQAFQESAYMTIDNYLRLQGAPVVGNTEILTQMYVAKVEEVTGLVRYFRYYEPVITNILLDVGMDFFFGNQTARYTADIMHNRISLYLNE